LAGSSLGWSAVIQADPSVIQRNRPICGAAFSAKLSASDESDKLISSTLDYRETAGQRAKDTVGPGFDGEEDGREYVLHDA